MGYKLHSIPYYLLSAYTLQTHNISLCATKALTSPKRRALRKLGHWIKTFQTVLLQECCKLLIAVKNSTPKSNETKLTDKKRTKV